jgi:hypothetical protein
MNIMELGAIGELVGGVAVIGSLIYVGLQVRQSNRLEKAESIRAATRDYVAAMLQIDADLIRRAILSFEQMSKDDQWRAQTWLAAIFTVGETEVALSKQKLAGIGTMPPALASLLRSPGLRLWWRAVGPTFDEDFRHYVEEANSAHRGDPAIHELFPWLSPDSPVAGDIS